MSKRDDRIAEQLKSAPSTPGVYVFKGAGEKVLYVGKAKNLRSRLSSYFQKSSSLDRRKQAMVALVRDFSTIVTSGELEALALEANLIKQYRPRFNVILRDDKNYPYLKLTLNENWPCLHIARRPQKDGAMYFGPYVPSSSMYEAMKFIKRNFGIRPCRYKLDERKKTSRPCIQHQMGRCQAPCAGLVDKREYDRAVQEVVNFLKGKTKDLLASLKAEMLEMSEHERYEEAAEVRDRIRNLERAWESQKVIAPELGDLDVVGIYAPPVDDDAVVEDKALPDKKSATAYGKTPAIMAVVLFVRSGTMIGAREFLIRNVHGAPEGEILREFLLGFYSKGVMPPPVILLPYEAEEADSIEGWLSQEAGSGVSLKVPQRGKKKGLVTMATENARSALAARTGREGPGEIMDDLALRLGLDATPTNIGAFDVSNTMGTNPVGGYVVWEDGEFMKEGYRHVRIKDVEGIDDYAMMRETVRRVLGSTELPGLIVIDGGRGHLDAVLGTLEEMGIQVPIIGLAKKPDRAFMPGQQEPVALSGREPSSLLLRRIRDEVHRFSVGYHKKLRSKELLTSPLESIPGIGKSRRLALLRAFGSLEGIRGATLEQLTEVTGMNSKTAAAVRDAFDNS